MFLPEELSFRVLTERLLREQEVIAVDDEEEGDVEEGGEARRAAAEGGEEAAAAATAAKNEAKEPRPPRVGGAGGAGLRTLYEPGLSGLKSLLAQYEWLLERLAPEVSARLSVSFVFCVFLPSRKSFFGFFRREKKKNRAHFFLPLLVNPSLSTLSLSREQINAKQDLGIPPVLYAAQWLLTAFACPFPPAVAARVIDAVLLERSPAPLLRAALAVAVALGPALLAAPTDFEQALKVLKLRPAAWTAEESRIVLSRGLCGDLVPAGAVEAAAAAVGARAEAEARLEEQGRAKEGEEKRRRRAEEAEGGRAAEAAAPPPAPSPPPPPAPLSLSRSSASSALQESSIASLEQAFEGLTWSGGAAADAAAVGAEEVGAGSGGEGGGETEGGGL